MNNLKCVFVSLLLGIFSTPVFSAEESQGNVYSAMKSASLRETIKLWSSANDYTVKWNVKNREGQILDWFLPADIKIDEDYKNAISTLLDAYHQHGIEDQMVWFDYSFYTNNVLTITWSNPNE